MDPLEFRAKINSRLDPAAHSKITFLLDFRKVRTLRGRSPDIEIIMS